MCFGLPAKVNSARLPDARLVQECDGRSDQLLGDALVPEIRPHADRADEAEASPPGDDARADQRVVQEGAERRLRIGPPACRDQRPVAREIARIGKAEKFAEGLAENPIGGRNIGLLQGANDKIHRGDWFG